jgi:hypothetical protein
MKRELLLYCAGAITCLLPVGCAHYPESREQRPVYSYENVEMGPSDSGQEYRQGETGNRKPDRPLR